MTARGTGKTVGIAVEPCATSELAAPLIVAQRKAVNAIKPKAAAALLIAHENVACAGMAVAGIALAAFGAPFVPRSLCIVIGLGCYIAGALHCKSDRVGGLMVAGPLLLSALWSLWMVFVYADAGNITRAVEGLLGAVCSGLSAAWGFTLVMWYHNKDAFGAATLGEEREPRQRATTLAHSRFAGQPHASVADTEI